VTISGDPFLALPKVELHRHLEGSLRLETLLDIARVHNIDVPIEITRLGQLVQVQAGEAFTFQNFLSKFVTLRKFYRSPEIIQRVTREAVEDAARDNVRYLELRFTPVALSRAEGFQMEEVIQWVCESSQAAAGDLGITVRLIASVNRHEDTALAEQVARLAADRSDRCIVGLDLAGNEAEFSALPFAGIFHEAHQAGLRLTVHAGEWAGAQSVRVALVDLDAERIGHGVRILEDKRVVAIARERKTAFEVCVTSNFQTGAVPALKAHPLVTMHDLGLNVTLGTDDPGISQITLSAEYRQAFESLGMSVPTIKQSILAAAKASFLPDQERETLIARIKLELEI
jgi:adenosine deaminase